jgi:hypothetical protein
MTVWLCQCLCPDRHTIVAAAGEADSEAQAQPIRTALRGKVLELLRAGLLNPWCAICNAKLATWRYELAATKFARMEEAAPELTRVEAENAATLALYGDIHRTTKPN